MKNCATALNLATDIGIINYFRLTLEDQMSFDIGMNKVARLMVGLDIILGDSRITDFITKHRPKRSERKRMYEEIRLLVIPYVFLSIDRTYAHNFIKEFIFPTSTNDYVRDYTNVIEVLIGRRPKNPNDYESIVDSIIDQTQFDRFHFKLNLIYYANILEGEWNIKDFIGYYLKNAQQKYWDYEAEQLGL
jgi:hypothetical protein